MKIFLYDYVATVKVPDFYQAYFFLILSNADLIIEVAHPVVSDNYGHKFLKSSHYVVSWFSKNCFYLHKIKDYFINDLKGWFSDCSS